MKNFHFKLCSVCKEYKPFDMFNNRSSSKDGKDRLCKYCYQQYCRRIAEEKQNGTYQSKCRQARLTDEQRESKRLEQIEYQKKYRQEKRTKINLQKKSKMLQSKIEGMKIYGGCCQCCGESNEKFLTLEHLNGRDKSKKRRTGLAAWNIARIEGYPDTYTVLCFNCNCAKGIYGVCPHQEKKTI
jgi:hypothetical protein